MPGIEMSVFREQVDQLMLAFTRPTDFLHQLRGIFERYGLPAHRPSGLAPNLPEPAYHLPPLVLREIEINLPAFCSQNTGAALRLGDLLAIDRFAEVRLLAGEILGNIPSTEAEDVLDALRTFCEQEESALMRRQFVLRGSRRLRSEVPAQWLAWIEDHMRANHPQQQETGLVALFSVIEDAAFLNLPPVYRLLEPYLLNPPRQQDNLLRSLGEALAVRSPVETAYFLQEIAPFAIEQRGRRLIRAWAAHFDAEQERQIRRGLAESEQKDAG
jgi:hypothetical protein